MWVTLTANIPPGCTPTGTTRFINCLVIGCITCNALDAGKVAGHTTWNVYGGGSFDGESPLTKESTSTFAFFATDLAASFAAVITLALSASVVSTYKGHLLHDLC